MYSSLLSLSLHSAHLHPCGTNDTNPDSLLLLSRVACNAMPLHLKTEHCIMLHAGMKIHRFFSLSLRVSVEKGKKETGLSSTSINLTIDVCVYHYLSLCEDEGLAESEDKSRRFRRKRKERHRPIIQSSSDHVKWHQIHLIFHALFLLDWFLPTKWEEGEQIQNKEEWSGLNDCWTTHDTVSHCGLNDSPVCLCS